MDRKSYQKDFIDNSQFGIATPETFGGYVAENKHGIDDPVKDLNIGDQNGFGNVIFDSDDVLDSQTYILQNASGIITLQDHLFTSGRIPFVDSDGLLTDSSNFTTETIGTSGDRVNDGYFVRLNVGATGGLQFQAVGDKNIFIVQSRIDFNDTGNNAKISLVGATQSSETNQTITLPDNTGTVALLGDDVSQFVNDAGYVDDTFVNSSTYTPSATNVTNITASTPNSASYTKVSDIVTVFGTITVTNTLAIASEVDISLPIASNLGAATDVNGLATMDSTASVNIYIKGDVTNDRASIFFTSAGVGQTSTIYYSFQYKII